MPTLFITVFCLAVIAVVVMSAIRIHLHHQTKDFLDRFINYPVYSSRLVTVQSDGNASGISEGLFIDLRTDLTRSFHGQIIPGSQGVDFIDYYKPFFQESSSLAKKLKTFHIDVPEIISNLIRDFEKQKKDGHYPPLLLQFSVLIWRGTAWLGAGLHHE